MNVLTDGYTPKNIEKIPIKTGVDSLENKEYYSMIFPPPNVTGYIHLGHCLTATIQDVISRQNRKNGKFVEWIPGMDHAGIATQTVVEKALLKSLGVTRYDLGREKFLQKIWNWKESRSNKTIKDLMRLGVTMDWEKEYFTMDEVSSSAIFIEKLLNFCFPFFL